MEIWKSIFGWSGRYEVSNLGRVRSVDRRYRTAKYGGLVSFKGRVLKKNISKKGYSIAILSKPAHKTRCFNVHTLVLRAFKGRCPRGQECCHNNGKRADNRAGNLRYDTRSNNALDRHKHGTMVKLFGRKK